MKGFLFYNILAGIALIKVAVCDGIACEPITVPMCEDIGYNTTAKTNLYGNEQRASELTIRIYYPLLKFGCSPCLKDLLCINYLPECPAQIGRSTKPCRYICENAKAGCISVMTNFAFEWPDELNCAKFPEENCQESNCIPATSTTQSMLTSTPKSQMKTLLLDLNEQLNINSAATDKSKRLIRKLRMEIDFPTTSCNRATSDTITHLLQGIKNDINLVRKLINGM